MAGRNYNIPVCMPVPQVNSEKPKRSLFHHILYEDFDMDELDQEDDFGSIVSPSVQLCLLIMFFAAIVTGACVYFIAVFYYDFHNGAASSSDLASDVAQMMDDFSYENIQSYLPRALREDGFISDSDIFAGVREQINENGYAVSSVRIIKEELFTDVSQLEQGLFSVYGQMVSVSEAKIVQLQVMFADMDQKQVSAVMNVISMKIRHKWYFYTGTPVIQNDSPVEFITLQDDILYQNTEDTMDISYVAKQEPVEIPADEIVPLDFKKDALSELKSGRFTMQEKEYTMPSVLADFADIFEIDKDRLPESLNMTLLPNEIIGNLPVKGKEAQDVFIYAAVGNPTAELIDIKDAYVTTFCISSNDKVSVFLPGNVTFGTVYADVVKMYDHLTQVTNDEFKGILSDAVYCLTLSNSHNKIYFGFKNGKLVEIQWYYVDMTDYREI